MSGGDRQRNTSRPAAVGGGVVLWCGDLVKNDPRPHLISGIMTAGSQDQRFMNGKGALVVLTLVLLLILVLVVLHRRSESGASLPQGGVVLLAGWARIQLS